MFVCLFTDRSFMFVSERQAVVSSNAPPLICRHETELRVTELLMLENRTVVHEDAASVKLNIENNLCGRCEVTHMMPMCVLPFEITRCILETQLTFSQRD